MRPVLAPDAFVRTYVGAQGPGWIVVRRARGARVAIDATVRILLELADGARELEEIAREAGRRAAQPIGPRDAFELLRPLLDSGAVVDATGGFAPLERPARTGLEVIRLDDLAAAALTVSLPAGLGTDCDGRGGCCRLYDRILLTAADAGRIVETYGDEYTPGGLTVERAVVRDRYDQDDDLFSLAVVDGACVLLEEDGLCGVHRRLGLLGKPAGCRAYPLRDVLCGDQLDVGVGVECRCVVDFANGPSLRPAAEEVRIKRATHRFVEAVAETVPVTLSRRFERSEYRAWRTDAASRLASADDVAAWAWGEAVHLCGGPLETSAPLGGLTGLLDELVLHLEREAESTASVYSASDLQVRLFAWAAAAAGRLRSSAAEGVPDSSAGDGERLLAAMQLHVHGVLRSRTLAVGLASLALRLWLARAGAPLELPRELLPVTSVEYLHRAHGFSELADDHATWIEDALAGRSPSVLSI